MLQGSDGRRCEEEEKKGDVVMLEGYKSGERPLEDEEPATDTDLMNEGGDVEFESEVKRQGKQL